MLVIKLYYFAGRLGQATTIGSLTFKIEANTHSPVFRYDLTIMEVQDQDKRKEIGRGGSNELVE